MPYKITKLHDGYYKVTKSTTGKIFAYHTTKKNAESQVRYLHYIERSKNKK